MLVSEQIHDIKMHHSNSSSRAMKILKLLDSLLDLVHTLLERGAKNLQTAILSNSYT